MEDSQEEEKDRIDEEFLNSLSEDALSLFRINLVVLTIFATVFLFVTQEMTRSYYLRFGDSIYTLTAVLLWAGSLFLSAYAYYVTRRARVREYYKNRGAIDDELLYLSTVATVAFGSVIAILSLIMGLIDGFSDGGISVVQPVGILGFSLIFLLFVWNILSGIELVRQSVPDWIWEAFYGNWRPMIRRFNELVSKD